jgi:chemotaxis protein CheD
MKSIIDVNTGEVQVSDRDDILRSLAIGSCIVVAAFDAKKRIAGMAHIMLPGRAPKKELQKTKYAVNAIVNMLEMMTKAGSHSKDIEACLVGAGNVLEKPDETICKDNIQSVIRSLIHEGITIVGSVLGGTKRKGISLDAETGTITYSEGDSKEKFLWKAKAIG